MITRRAIIIGNSGGYRNLSFLKGVAVDVDNYRSFLMSKAGGQWKDNEIITLRDSDSNSVINTIKQTETDYSFITYSGHGQISSYTPSDYVCLTDTDLSIGKLVSPSQKQTIVIDSFRKSITSLQKDELIMEDKSNTEGIDSREIFNEAIQTMPKGILVIYSTQANEAGGEDEFKGGHFTYSFIKSGKSWWEHPKNRGILRIGSAVNEAEKIMTATFSTNQKPAMGGQVRRLTFPPFAFSKK